MQIVRTETPTGGPNRTRREEIVQLFTGQREVEPECYLDCSESEGWPWASDESKSTWPIQLEAARQFIAPFESLDSQAAEEQASGSDEMGGVYFYPFSNVFLPVGKGDDDGDLNSSNFDRKMTAFIRKYFDRQGNPRGGTEIMSAVRAGDEHFMGEFGPDGEEPTARDERPVRARVVWTDGMLNDDEKFRRYLAQATASPEGFGSHGEWDEVWAVAIIGEPGSAAGKAAYEQYAELAKGSPWIHPYYFEGVTNPAEIAEDMAVAVVPAGA
jgi:hypothetical protein